MSGPADCLRGAHIPPPPRIHSNSRRTHPAPRDGVLPLKGSIEERAQDLARYIIEHRATVRRAAAVFGISKSTVHKDLQDRLPGVNPALYRQVKVILDENKAERHIRGGIATRRKYKGK